MADTPDVLKRLEEIEGRGLPLPSEDYYWLLHILHALLESQRELISVRHTIEGMADSPCGQPRSAHEPK